MPCTPTMYSQRPGAVPKRLRSVHEFFGMEPSAIDRTVGFTRSRRAASDGGCYRRSRTSATSRSHVVDVTPVSRSGNFCILPVGVFGSSATTSMYLGTMK